MYDMIVIGGGPAALSAMYYAHGKQLKVVMLGETMGGKVEWLQHQAEADHQRPVLGTDLVRPLLTWMSEHEESVIHDRVRGVVARPGSADGFEVATDYHDVLQSATVVVATGAGPLHLHVPGAARLLDHGLQYSIATHALGSAGKSVAVIGATTRSQRGAAELVRTAAQVYLIVADPAELDTGLGWGLRRQPNLEVLENCTVREVIGTHSVEAVVVEREGQGRSINVQQVFVDLGLTPNSDLVHGLVSTDANGFIRIDRHNATTMPGIFAAGDVTTTIGEQIVIAIGDGARAAQSGYDYVLARQLALRAARE